MTAPAAIDTLVVVGPTATGKTRLAVHLARLFDGEIISADSRQVYRGMDVGTGKDLNEYGDGPAAVPHHLIDVATPTEEYNLYRYVVDAAEALRNISGRGRLPVIAGGTPLYVNALLDGYRLEGGEADPHWHERWNSVSDADLAAALHHRDPGLFERTDLTQRKRLLRALEISSGHQTGVTLPRLRTVILAPYYSRKCVHARIEQRLDERLGKGLVEEVRRLQEGGMSWERLEGLGLEYRWVARFLQGQLSSREMRASLLARIRRLCRAQDIWYRKMERAGKIIHWLPGGDERRAEALVRLFLQGLPLPAPDIQIADVTYGPVSPRSAIPRSR